jgi:hypothetical protein
MRFPRAHERLELYCLLHNLPVGEPVGNDSGVAIKNRAW